jgi:SPP1 gp7 family putative phage head morphogenesis protein
LRKIAQHVSDLISAFDPSQPGVTEQIEMQLEQYAQLIDPWAKAVSQRMIAEVNSRDRQAWRETGEKIGRNLRREIEDAPVGRVMRELLDEQTSLITSIPRKAAERVRAVTLKGISEGLRPAAYVDDIMRTGHVTKSRATLIARTEVARTASMLTQVRAESVGATHYIWTTAGDSNVRPSHKKLNGKVFAFADPPVCDPPDHRANPGQIWNCRCIARPIIPEID